jgi:hypothetical protein
VKQCATFFKLADVFAMQGKKKLPVMAAFK